MNEHSNSPVTLVEFCAGYTGLGLGLERVFGERLQLVGLCELEGFAQANLVSKMEAGLLAQVPVWPDLRTFPYRKFRGLVDIAAAGIPCQPHSHAGKREGGNDKRFLFDEWIDGLALMQPGIILIENVEGLLSSRMPDGSLCIGHVLRRLEEIGYRVETPSGDLSLGIFSASEVGAPHQRKRVFIMAYNQRERVEELCRQIAVESEFDTVRDDGGNVWPSRPGEPQHDWEPPRTC